MNPGNATHLKVVTEGWLRSKGIQVGQEYKDGKPVHPVVVEVVI
jgi:hypothetical protein